MIGLKDSLNFKISKIHRMKRKMKMGSTISKMPSLIKLKLTKQKILLVVAITIICQVAKPLS